MVLVSNALRFQIFNPSRVSKRAELKYWGCWSEKSPKIGFTVPSKLSKANLIIDTAALFHTSLNIFPLSLFLPISHSRIASIHSLATPIGSLASAGIMDTYGRRSALMLSIMPLLSGWCIIALSNSHTAILIGRVVCGIAVGLMSAPAQVREFNIFASRYC